MGFSSQAGQVVLRTQTAKGVLAPDLATAGVAVLLRSGSLGSSRELLVPDPEIGGGRDTKNAYLGSVSWAGDYDLYARANAVATLLKAALGTAEAPVTADGATTHVIKPSDASQLPFLSIAESIGSNLENYQYIDAVVNTFHLEVDANGYLICTVGLIGARQTAGVARPDATALFDEGPMFLGHNTTIEYAGVKLPATSFSLDINNNFADDAFELGSFYLTDLTPQAREVTASFNIRHANSALWRQATYGASSAVTPQGTTVKDTLTIHTESYETIDSSTERFSIDIEIPSYVLTPFSFEASGADVIENDVEGQALRPSSATPILTATVVTDKATIS